MSQQSQKRMGHMFVLPYLFYVPNWSQRGEGYVPIKTAFIFNCGEQARPTIGMYT
jgi:hypothetical protein